MKDLVLEIQTIKNMMGLKNVTNLKILNEVAGPKPLWVKLGKYFDELLLGGEKTFDDLAKKGTITNEELNWLKKNASVVSKKAKSITDPNIISDTVLNKFKNIVNKISKDEIEKLSKTAFDSWLSKNPNIFDPVEKLIDELTKLKDEYSKLGSNEVLKGNEELSEYLNKGGSWDEIFKLNLETQGYKDELLDLALDRFEKNNEFKPLSSEKLDIDGIIDNEIKKVLDDPTFNDLTSLEKLQKLNVMKKNLTDNLIKGQVNKISSAKISEKEIEKIVNEKIKSISDQIDTFYTKTFINDFLLSIKDISGLADEFISLGQLFNSTAEKNISTLKDEISDIIVLIERGELTENYYREVANRIKAISSNAKKMGDSVNKFWDDLQKLITNTYPNDPAKAKEIIDKIGGPNKLDEFFTKTSQYISSGDRIKEAWQKILDTFGKFKSFDKEIKDQSSNILKFSEGPAKRLANFITSGSLTSFREWTQRLLQRRKFLFVGKEIQGFGWKSYFDLYCRIWFITNFSVPIVTSFLSGLSLWGLVAIGKLTGLGDETKYFVENKDKSIGQLWEEFYVNSLKSSFAPFVKDYNEKTGGKFPQTTDQWVEWSKDIVSTIIPFNTKIDDIWDFIVNTPIYLSKVESLKNQEIEKGKEQIEKFKDKLKGRDKIFVEKNGEDLNKVTNSKKVEDYRNYILDKLNMLYYDLTNQPSKIGEEPSSEESDRLFKKIIYDGKPGTYDENKFYILINGKKYKYVDNTYYIDPTTGEKKVWKTLGKRLYENKINDMKNYVNKIKKIILEQEEEKTLKMKDWDEIFTFQKVDEKNPGKYTDVKIKMDSVMDRMPHWRKKYGKQCEELDNCDDDGEDDSFVRAVIDTHPEVVRILFTKGLAHLTSSDDQEDLNEGLHSLLALIREAKNVEVEVWSVYRHPSSPDKIWSLVKGDYKPKELQSMDVKMQKSPGNSVEKKKNSLDELKKKESDAIKQLSLDEKKGLTELPIKVRNNIKEKIKKGWTTEKPSSDLLKFYKEDKIDSVFELPIKIYKLKPNQDFFNFIKTQKSNNQIKRGFCRSIYYVKKELNLEKEVSNSINNILNNCEKTLAGKYGQNYI